MAEGVFEDGLRVCNQGTIQGKLRIKVCCEQVVCRGPPGADDLRYLREDGPFRTQHLVAAAEEVSEDVRLSREVSRFQEYIVGFRPTEKLPCQLAEGVGNCPPLLADVGHHRVVAHCCHSLVGDCVLEGLKRQKQSLHLQDVYME